jgi:3-ketosteroid 9alpha-monooxygenase subunit B
MSQYHRLRVTALIDETHDAKSVVFEVPASLAQAFKYVPGQFLTLRLPIDGVFVPRCYSMSSTPGLDSAPRVTVKRVHQGRGSNWICNQLKVGDALEVMPPSGIFTPKQLQQDLLLMAGGSGITPVFSILRHALAQSSARITLLYANRDEKSVIFRDALNTLAKAHPQRLQVIHWLDSVQGIPSVEQLAEFARPQAHAQAFICGPGPFMDAAVQAALNSVNMAEADIHVERFVSFPDEVELAAAQTARQNEAPRADAD